jgi:ketosteroid isomerase-like protein
VAEGRPTRTSHDRGALKGDGPKIAISVRDRKTDLPASTDPGPLDHGAQAADTGRAMTQENVESFRRAARAYDRRDIDALLEELHPDVEWHPVLQVLLGGETTVYRGHRGVRDLVRDVDATFAEFHGEVSEVQDLGDHIVATGRMRARGKASGAETNSPFALVMDFRDGKG